MGEYVSKVTHTIINALGIIALVIGIAEMQQLNFRDPDRNHINTEMDLDLALLRFTSIFSFLYMIFTIITGTFNGHLENYPNELNIVNGCIAITQICMQISFIYNLKHRVSINSNYSQTCVQRPPSGPKICGRFERLSLFRGSFML
jgi:hypothetical protein